MNKTWDLFGALTTSAADVVLASDIPTSEDAQAILTATASAADTDKINRATIMLQTFFAVRKQLKDNKAKIASYATGIIPAEVISKNASLLLRTDQILLNAYVANGKQLLPYQPSDDIPATSFVESGTAGYMNGFGVVPVVTKFNRPGEKSEPILIESEVNAIKDETNAVTDAIDSATGTMSKRTKEIIKWSGIGLGILIVLNLGSALIKKGK